MAGGRRLLIGCSDGGASGAHLLPACSAAANVHCDDSSGASLLRACGVEFSALGVVSSGGGLAVFAAGASRPGSGHSYAHAGSSVAKDSLADRRPSTCPQNGWSRFLWRGCSFA